jgi:ABC-type nickel/cobalt efflux system permease component RcnA
MVDFASVIIVATAFALGLGHSLDPNHFIAVSTLLCNSTTLRKSVVSAALWGTRHSAVLLVVGLLVLGLRVVIPENVVQLLELIAGIGIYKFPKNGEGNQKAIFRKVRSCPKYPKNSCERLIPEARQRLKSGRFEDSNYTR